MKLRSQLAILLIAVFLITNTMIGEDVDSHREAMLEHFKNNIGFDKLPPVEHSSRGVVVAWPDIRQAPDLGPHWQILADTTWWERNGGIKNQILGRGGERLVFTIFLAQAGEDAARMFLLDKVSQTTMAAIPYIRGPANLGTLSLTAGQPIDSVAWYFSNVVFQIEATNTALNILPLAKSLQSLAEGRVVPNIAANAPKPRSVMVSNRNAPIGQTVTVRLSMDQDKGQFNYVLDLEFDRSQISILSQNDDAFTLKGLRPGPATVKAHLIDKRTLVSSSLTIDLVFSQ